MAENCYFLHNFVHNFHITRSAYKITDWLCVKNKALNVYLMKFFVPSFINSLIHSFIHTIHSFFPLWQLVCFNSTLHLINPISHYSNDLLIHFPSIHSFSCPLIKFDLTFVCHRPSISSSAKKTQASIIYWVEWRWNRREVCKAICSFAHSFARAAQPFACSALLGLFARSAALTRKLIHLLPGSWGWGLCIWI